MRHRHGEKEGCRDERKAELKKKRGRARFHLLLHSVLITEPRPITPSQPEARHLIDLPNHKLVFFQNVSNICLFKHPLKDRTECTAVITMVTVISIIILITGAPLSHCKGSKP